MPVSLVWIKYTFFGKPSVNSVPTASGEFSEGLLWWLNLLSRMPIVTFCADLAVRSYAQDPILRVEIIILARVSSPRVEE